MGLYFLFVIRKYCHKNGEFHKREDRTDYIKFLGASLLLTLYKVRCNNFLQKVTLHIDEIVLDPQSKSWFNRSATNETYIL
jgi:hypothetical protein